MLKLRRQRPIRRSTRPIIRPSAIPVRAKVDHGLDRKAHPRFRSADCLVLPVVRDVGRAVEEPVHAVAAVALDDAAVLALGVLLDGVSGFSE